MCDNQSHYEINVSKDGRHFFATHPRSGTEQSRFLEVIVAVRTRFPRSEGYDVTVTHWECSGKELPNMGRV